MKFLKKIKGHKTKNSKQKNENQIWHKNKIIRHLSILACHHESWREEREEKKEKVVGVS
jgi:hypothetical protein